MCLVSFFYAILMSAKITYIFVYSFIRPCRFVVSLYDCKLSELLVILPLLGMMYSLVPVALERIYATAKYRNYEKSKCLFLSFGLIATVWTAALFIQLRSLMGASKSEFTPFCVNVMVMSTKAAVGMLITGLVQECLALGLYLLTYYVNKTLYTNLLINRATVGQTLSGRFQLAQNIQVRPMCF